MKKSILKLVNNLLLLGINEKQSVIINRQVRTLNRISFFLLVINIILLIFNFLLARYMPLFLNIAIICIICFPIFFLNHTLRHNLAQIYSFFVSNSLILLYAYIGISQNRIVSFEVLILGCAFFGAFIYHSSWGFFALFYSLSSYLIIGYFKIQTGQAIPDNLFLGSLINYFATTLFLFAMIHMYKQDFIASEKALSKSDDRFSLVLKGSNNGWWDWDLVGDELYYSPLWWSMLGYQVNEFESDSSLWRRLTHPDDLERVNAVFTRALESDDSGYEIEIRFLHKSGHYVSTLSKGFILRDKTGKAIRVSGSNIDLTEHKQAEEKLHTLVQRISEKNETLSKQKSEILIQSEKLAELNQLKDKLFSIIAHDIRSPITTLILTLNSVQDETLTEEDLREILPDITMNANNILELIESLFDWARSQFDGAQVNPTKFEINKLVEDEMSLLAFKAKEKGIILRNNIMQKQIVFADRNMIQLVIRNLISNALKFCSLRDEIIISSKEKEKFIEISVSDSGKGISPENLEKVFTTALLSTQGTSGEKGTGLGLILSKEFVEKNYGKIGVESESLKGSRFYFTIPVAND